LAAAAPASKEVLIDLFGGAGGNAIAFARSGRWKRVYVVEKDPLTLECAKHNAKVYGVDHLISWYEGDCFEVIKKDLKDFGDFAVLFASPPWGGELFRMYMIIANRYRPWLQNR
jgi:tRNA G37 N-methylase Trm5